VHQLVYQRTLKGMMLCLYLLVLSSFSIGASLPSGLPASGGDEALELAYNEVFSRGFIDLNKQFSDSSFIKRSFSSLNTHVSEAQASGKHESALLLLSLNRGLLKENLYKPELIEHFNYLLNQDAMPLAAVILSWAEEEGDFDILSRLHYHLAHYYFQRGEWEKASQHLTAIENKNALTAAQGDYATIIFGITLQNAKHHRAAIKYYDEIKPESIYFSYAQLNKAVAFIRQGWWTDAKIAIDKALQQEPVKHTEEFTNRLYLVLGYSQLQHEFYRNARENFRHITLDSQYADRALLGIGLCALHQGDYAGALNAFGILKNKDKSNISVTESHLLFAFTHEQMRQTTLASAHYEEAIAYYQGRIRRVEQALAELSSADNSNTMSHTETVSPPAYLVLQARNLRYLADKVSNKKLKLDIAKLQRQLSAATTDYSKKILNQRKETLISYLSQSQFGQAKLFDKLQ